VTQAKTLGAALAAVVVAGLAVAAMVRAPNSAGPDVPKPEASPLPEADPLLEARTKGSPDAPVTLYELSDFQCPFCRTFFEETWPLILREYVETGKIKVTFLNLPLISIHPNAAEAHEHAMCAALQDQFWQMHDRLFETQETWAPMEDPTPHFRKLGEQLDLDQQAFTQCLNTGETRSIVAGDVQLAIQGRLNSTPSFIVEGGLVQGLVPIEGWRSVLDSIYAVKSGSGQ
jgi:protein-disulfide isomerase